MDRVIDNHLLRIKTAILKRYTASMIAKWIVDKTTHNMSPFSYEDHEYQERILSDTSQEINVRKCSQVGVSEGSARKAVSLVNVLQPYTVIYTLPTATFASTFMKTRVDPIINDAEELREGIHKVNNNSEVKQFALSYLYLKGAASSNAPISVPADHLIHDELDFCDQEVIGQYVSRLSHSKWKRTDRFSTPTLPDFGIDREFKQSRRHFLFVKCDHCNHQFIPDYYKHVRVPGFTGDLVRITKNQLAKIAWREARVHCPSCGKIPSLQHEHREWVGENPSENLVAAAYQVAPFDAPNVLHPVGGGGVEAFLIEASTKYDRIQDFHNFGLGLPSADNEATLVRADLEDRFLRSEAGSSVQYVMGVDVGNVYHFVIAAVDGYGDMFVVHCEKVPMGQARKRYGELRREFRVICTVIDSNPHSETVMALQQTDPNLYASVYMKKKSILTHTVKDKEEVKEEGKEFLRQVDINRNRALDGYMTYVRDNHIFWKDAEYKEEVIAHHISMKRVKVYSNDSGEMEYSWQKTDGVDHFHHAHLYCWIAGRIRGVGRPIIALPTFTVMKFRLKQ